MFSRVVQGYGWDSAKEFLLSLFPSVKYHLTLSIIGGGAIGAIIQELFGFNWLSVVAFILMAVVELFTGLYASLAVKNELYESHKIGRFTIKLFVYLAVFFIVYTFEKDFKETRPVVSAFFEWFYNGLFIYTAQEYLVSVLENIAVIRGKSKTFFIEAIKEKIKNLF